MAALAVDSVCKSLTAARDGRIVPINRENDLFEDGEIMGLTDDATHRDVADYWTRLANEYEEAARPCPGLGPIESAARAGCISDELRQTTWYAAHRAEQAYIDPTPLLAFVQRPDLGALVTARIVIMRLSIKPDQPGVADGTVLPMDQASAAVKGNELKPMAGLPSMSGELLLTVAQAAKRAQVDEKTIRRLIKSGRLRASPFGKGSKRKNHRIDPADLAAVKPDAELVQTNQPRPRRRQATSSAAAFLPQVR